MITKINDHRIVHVHVREVPIVYHHHIIINNHHHNEITLDRREIIIIFMIEEITIVIDRIIFIIMETIIEVAVVAAVVVVVVIDSIKRLTYILIVNLAWNIGREISWKLFLQFNGDFRWEKTVHVSNIPYDMRWAALKDLFRTEGKICCRRKSLSDWEIF